jgi:acyl-coenzyme A synthetase/AMP-(fatty) acid ligase
MREVPELPLNTNGKVGRRALEALLEAEANPCRRM